MNEQTNSSASPQVSADAQPALSTNTDFQIVEAHYLLSSEDAGVLAGEPSLAGELQCGNPPEKCLLGSVQQNAVSEKPSASLAPA